MGATTGLDLQLLRALRSGPRHGYALLRDLGPAAPDRATVYRRLSALREAGLIAAHARRGAGAPQKAYALTAAGEARLRDELREAMMRLLEAFAARGSRSRGAKRMPQPPIVMVSGSRMSGVETRILASLARGAPGRVHLVAPPGTDVERAPSGVGLAEGSWTNVPYRDAYARTLFVNELPRAQGLGRAAKEWARVLAPGGRLNVVAPMPLPRGVDPFVDFLADLRDELHPDSAHAPANEAVERALRGARFEDIDTVREADQRIWRAVAPA